MNSSGSDGNSSKNVSEIRVTLALSHRLQPASQHQQVNGHNGISITFLLCSKRLAAQLFTKLHHTLCWNKACSVERSHEMNCEYPDDYKHTYPYESCLLKLRLCTSFVMRLSYVLSDFTCVNDSQCPVLKGVKCLPRYLLVC